MKKLYSSIVVTILFAACSNGAVGPSSSNVNTGSGNQGAGPNRGQAELTLDGSKVSVEYGRPTLRGRDLKGMISPGQEWRMGADAATTLTTEAGLKFGDKVVPKGKYVLRAKFVEEPGKWNLVVYREDETPVAEVPLTFKEVDNSAESMTINLEKKDKAGRFILHWGKLTLSTDFQKAS